MDADLSKRILTLEKLKKSTEQDIEIKKKDLLTISEELYNLKLRAVHIEEIYRLATLQFSRLRARPGLPLTDADMAELSKWIGRAKGSQGLMDIIEALKELQKYYPGDIKSNLYALTQRIIIGGAYKKGKK
jgi:hypothetical protein